MVKFSVYLNRIVFVKALTNARMQNAVVECDAPCRKETIMQANKSGPDERAHQCSLI